MRDVFQGKGEKLNSSLAACVSEDKVKCCFPGVPLNSLLHALPV